MTRIKDFILGFLFTTMILSMFLLQGGIIQSKHNIFILTNDIGMGYEDYSDLISTLNNARPGDVVKIVLNHNHGGYTMVLDPILKAMKETKATTETFVVGYASSCAMNVLLAGKIVHIPKKDYIGTDHLEYIGTEKMKIRPAWLLESGRNRNIGHKRFETTEQFNEMMNGADVDLDGTQVCKIARPAIDTDTSCVIYQ